MTEELKAIPVCDVCLIPIERGKSRFKNLTITWDVPTVARGDRQIAVGLDLCPSCSHIFNRLVSVVELDSRENIVKHW